MRTIFVVTIKELVLLGRDRAGLVVLFIMPAILVMVITLVQENVLELTGQKKTEVLLLDLDEGKFGQTLRGLMTTDQVNLVSWNADLKSLHDVEEAVAGGEYQLGVVLPKGTSAKMVENVRHLFEANRQEKSSSAVDQLPVVVFFDPGIMPALRSGLSAQLQMALETIGMGVKIDHLQRELKTALDSLGVPPHVLPPSLGALPEIISQPLLSMDSGVDGSGGKGMPPYNPVQQNVPAWALFGMFFTSIPIAGSILQERNSGILLRLMSLPVSPLSLLMGKMMAYIGICLCQFFLIELIGFFIFPFLGLPAFSVAQSFGSVLVTVFCCSLAACGYGLFLGSVCSTYEQASTVGSTTIVTAAAIGGIMVPVYAMPEIMQNLSILSPLNWGLNAFQELLVRGNSFSAILIDLSRLILFFLLMIFLAWKLTRNQSPGS